MPDLARAITTGVERLAAATAAWLRLVAEFDDRGGWHGVGVPSCAQWQAQQCGTAPVTAREHVRVARALRGLPEIAAAFGAGRLSYAKVRALTRIAAPDCKAALLEFATSATASQTERFWMRADAGAPLLSRIESRAEREARREPRPRPTTRRRGRGSGGRLTRFRGDDTAAGSKPPTDRRKDGRLALWARSTGP